MKRLHVFCALLVAFSGFSQQEVTLKDCEEAFQKNNLLLLSAQFNISASKAAVIQARIWDQPYISGEVNLYNPDGRQIFDAGKYGQKAVGVEQLIYVGGKKRNEIKLASANAQIAEYEFESLLNNLRFELRKSFYTIYFDAKKLESIDAQLQQIEILQNAYETQSSKGNVALKDVVRLQSLLLSLKNDRIEILKANAAERQNLSLLTGIDGVLSPVTDEQKAVSAYQNGLFQPESLLESARAKNPEFLIAQKNIEAQQTNLKWQKSLAVPDVTLGVHYDQNSGAFANQTNLTLGIPLPLWNKNKGNIQIAKSQIDQAKTDSDYKSSELKAQIQTAYTVWLEQKKQLDNLKPSVIENLSSVNKGIFENFQKRNVSLFEFTDFMESYNTSVLQINELYKQLVLSGEAINHLTNSNNF